MAALVLLAALACFTIAFRSSAGWRESCLQSLVLFGICVAGMTEVLGLFGSLHRGPLTLAWVILCFGALWLRREPVRQPLRLGVIDGVLVALTCCVAVLPLAAAILSPPNSVDALGYHLPRVVYWAQSGSVAFVPVHYYNQLMMPPMAEYVMLHTYVLSGGDRLVNLVQFLGYAGSAVGVSLIAQTLGAGRRGQILAALFCATIPNGVLQASGAKNDFVLTLWLVAALHFALRLRRRWDMVDASGLAFSVALALLTKGTAYVFAPPLLLAPLWTLRRRWMHLVPAIAGAVLLIAGPQYLRNYELSGSILGFDSAHGDGKFRWRNDRIGVATTVSNVVRNVSQHLGTRDPQWNQRVYQAVLWIHERFGFDVNDPATTWWGTQFEPPRNSNHEADANNRWHLLALALAIPFLLYVRRPEWLWYAAGIVLAALAFCAVLRWQLYFTRMHLPLFVLGSPLFGIVAERLKAPVQLLLCWFLLDGARRYGLENWTRPLIGPSSLLYSNRDADYFRDTAQFGKDAGQYQEAVRLTLESGCQTVGIDNDLFQLEYPYQALLLQSMPAMRFQRVRVGNASAPYRPSGETRPCAMLCLDCASASRKRQLYQDFGEPIRIREFLLYLPQAQPGRK